MAAATRPSRQARWQQPHTIYLLTAPDGRKYVGMTNQPVEARWRGHVSTAFCIYSDSFSPHSVQFAIQKLGADGWSHEAIASAKSRDDARAVEKRLIEELRTWAPDGMNLRPGPQRSQSVRGHDYLRIGKGPCKTWPPQGRAA